MEQLSNNAIDLIALEVLGISRDVDNAATGLRQFTEIAAKRSPDPEELREDVRRILEDLQQASVDIRIVASNILNYTIAAETGKEVDNEPAG